MSGDIPPIKKVIAILEEMLPLAPSNQWISIQYTKSSSKILNEAHEVPMLSILSNHGFDDIRRSDYIIFAGRFNQDIPPLPDIDIEEVFTINLDREG